MNKRMILKCPGSCHRNIPVWLLSCEVCCKKQTGGSSLTVKFSTLCWIVNGSCLCAVFFCSPNWKKVMSVVPSRRTMPLWDWRLLPCWVCCRRLQDSPRTALWMMPLTHFRMRVSHNLQMVLEVWAEECSQEVEGSNYYPFLSTI